MSRRVTNVASGGWGVALFVLLITLPYTNAHSMSCSEDKIDQIIYKLESFIQRLEGTNYGIVTEGHVSFTPTGGTLPTEASDSITEGPKQTGPPPMATGPPPMATAAEEYETAPPQSCFYIKNDKRSKYKSHCPVGWRVYQKGESMVKYEEVIMCCYTSY